MSVMSFEEFDTLPVLHKSTASAAEIVAKMNAYGGVIIRKFLSADEVRQINSELDEPLRLLAPGSSHDQQLMKDFHGVQTKRLTNLVMLSAAFRKVLDDNLVHEIGEEIYREEAGDWWLTTAQVIEIGPGNKVQPLHRDLQNNPPFVKMGINAPTVIANFMLALSPFTAENGATRIIPGSQLWDEDYSRMSGTQSMTIPAELEPGDVLLFSGKVIHGGGANVTADQFRRGLVMPIQPAYLTPEEAYPFLVSMDVARTLPARVQKILGFRSLYPNRSPGLWQCHYDELAKHLGL